jgi:glycosyltransferase involved in cell wall biosynthesis
MAAGTWRGRARSLAGFATNPRRLRDADRIARSGLFDADYYQRRYPDVTASDTDPLIHYVLWGAHEGRSPHPLFDPAYYLEHNPDVARSSFLPLIHFLLHGASEQRNPGPYFDSSFYLSAHPGVAASGANPLVDFVKGGWRQGRNPSASFDCVAYTERYEDVRASGINPLVHYVEIGCLEGREAAALADVALAVEPRVPMRASSLREPGPPERVVVCLTHVCPWPTHAGNAYRVNRLLLRLQSDGFKVIPVIAPLPGEMPDIAAIRTVGELFSNVVVVDRNGSIHYLLQDVPDVLSSLDGEHTPRFSALLDEEAPVSQRERELLAIERRYCHDAVIAAVLRLHSALHRYVLLTEYAWMSRLLPLVDRRAIKVIDTHDVYSTKAAKVLKYGLRELWLSDEEEARRLKRADLVIAIQNEEHALLERLVPAIPVVTAGIDFELQGQPGLPDGRRILYVGSGNPMNVRGLQEFLRFAWPAIRQEVPDAELMVAGAVSEGARGLAGVNAVGRVDDLTELYRSARVVINPAHAGTGLKIKTLEALSHLRPIVTWPTGVEGLPDALKELCDVVQDWYEFGPRVVSRLRTERTEAFSPAERALIVIHISPDAVYRDLSREVGRLWREHAMPASKSTA